MAVPPIAGSRQPITPLVRAASEIRWATWNDLSSPASQRVFEELDNVHQRFFAAHRQVKEPRYIWPLLPLYAWSRRAEYPFVFSSLRESAGSVLDAGSGVTFFPLAIRELNGSHVTCLDRDANFSRRMQVCCELLSVPPIEFVVANLDAQLPLEDQQFENVICISVLEHLPSNRRLHALEELWRLVIPGGRLIVTLDVLLGANGEGIPLVEVGDFANDIRANLAHDLPTPPPLPADALTTLAPGFGLQTLETYFRAETRLLSPRWVNRWRHWLRKPLEPFPPMACLLLSLVKER